jgi:hypothetical protein
MVRLVLFEVFPPSGPRPRVPANAFHQAVEERRAADDEKYQPDHQRVLLREDLVAHGYGDPARLERIPNPVGR